MQRGNANTSMMNPDHSGDIFFPFLWWRKKLRERVKHNARGHALMQWRARTSSALWPLGGAHQIPHGLISAAAGLFVEAVPPTCTKHTHTLSSSTGFRDRHQADCHPSAHPHLPGRGATSCCLWTPWCRTWTRMSDQVGSDCAQRRSHLIHNRFSLITLLHSAFRQCVSPWGGHTLILWSRPHSLTRSAVLSIFLLSNNNSNIWETFLWSLELKFYHHQYNMYSV